MYRNQTTDGLLRFYDAFASFNNIYLNADFYDYENDLNAEKGMYLTCLMIPKALLQDDISLPLQIHVFLNKHIGNTYKG